MILSIESSCDDSSLALTSIKDAKLLVHFKLSQDAEHSPFGGVVPEIASRLHAENLPILLHRIKKHLSIKNPNNPFAPIKAIAVTNRPGLNVTLSEGVCMANALALSLRLPIIYINHLKAHIYSLFINKPKALEKLCILLVSGGHTQILYLQEYANIYLKSTTLDDSLGESFDKLAKMLKLGYPGGALVEECAKKYLNKNYIDFTIPLLGDKRIAFSFSGLKNALRLEIERQKKEGSIDAPRICASFQNTACAHIIDKLEKYFTNNSEDFEYFGVVGGVSANEYLSKELKSLCAKYGKKFMCAKKEFCTDNAAMVGRIAIEAYRRKEFDEISDEISPKSLQKDFL